MLAEIQDWDPNFDLQRATPEQRLKWRRSYTINWLYDLVNIFSAPVIERNTLKGQNLALENVDWSMDGPCGMHRRLFGLNEFAGLVTSLAMQKQGTDVRNKIQPHLVFQLQYIVDSLMVSRGFSITTFKGHVLQPPASQFRPRRDVDLFLDREQEWMGTGFLESVDIMEKLLKRDAMTNGNPNRHTEHMGIIKGAQEDFRDWLGESKYMYGSKAIPPSRFSKTNTNGLWEYSHYLCGVGLMEGLELSYLFGMTVWDRTPEPFLLIHLYNMLVKQGYITERLNLYQTLQYWFADAVFVDGKAPDSKFREAVVARSNEHSRHIRTVHRAMKTPMAQSHKIHAMLDVKGNRFFQKPSVLVSLRDADWNHERIPTRNVRPMSMVSMLRLAETEIVLDPKTGEPRVADTEVTSRLRADGIPEEALLKLSYYIREINSGQARDPAGMTKFATTMNPCHTPRCGPLPKLSTNLKTGMSTKADSSGSSGSSSDSSSGSSSDSSSGRSSGSSAQTEPPEMSSAEILKFLERDVRSDVCGEHPMSSLNYVCTTAQMHLQFLKMEDQLRKRRNPTYVRAYEKTGRATMQEKRTSFTAMALGGGDDECLHIMAETFLANRRDFGLNIYWEALEGANSEQQELRERRDDELDSALEQCRICSA